MKFTKLLKSAHIIAWINSMPKITCFHRAKNHNSPSINTAANSEISLSYSTNVNYLKPFDTASIAYYMMGFGNFK
ncbi:MAG: hypothetical protein RMY64_23745 [Nostoc sp. DedQUE08]|uniref:hypothetical protein n=1 Tax=unclassified Nostoc TaxID=2593658 RepID=UPI002AD51392|nr:MULTISPECIES: hypothetical protein [unclassified Nostoc]MDZ8068607.1 hypothetical protein [Nostoc sp. DedQUE08]MDZ8093298.1 hypothetical protein [Nostoc sp. DedQUE05]MDZ8130764.1 hypothetical protein [Nostoc sp. DedQUE07]